MSCIYCSEKKGYVFTLHTVKGLESNGLILLFTHRFQKKLDVFILHTVTGLQCKDICLLFTLAVTSLKKHDVVFTLHAVTVLKAWSCVYSSHCNRFRNSSCCNITSLESKRWCVL